MRTEMKSMELNYESTLTELLGKDMSPLVAACAKRKVTHPNGDDTLIESILDTINVAVNEQDQERRKGLLNHLRMAYLYAMAMRAHG